MAKKRYGEIIFDVLIVIVVILLYVFSAMFLYTNFRERKRKELANNIIEKIDKKIEENDNENNSSDSYDITYDSNKYTILGKIRISKIGIYQPILKENTTDSYNVSVVKISGPPLNTYGNVNIGGHNFMKGNFFIKINRLVNNDVVEITDMSGLTVKYYVYEYKTVSVNEAEYMKQPEDKSDKIVTLITCTKGGKERYYVKAKAK